MWPFCSSGENVFTTIVKLNQTESPVSIRLDSNVWKVLIEQVDPEGKSVVGGSWFSLRKSTLCGYKFSVQLGDRGKEFETVKLYDQINDVFQFGFDDLPKHGYYETWYLGTQMKKPSYKDYLYKITAYH